MNPSKIPFLKREPRNELEVLSLIVNGYKKLGIEKIIWSRTRFPDLLVKINGKEVYMELEVDSLSFQDHIKKRQLRPLHKGKFSGKLTASVRDTNDDIPVAILCWVNGDRKGVLKKRVPDLQVFELQLLLRTGKKIKWR